MQNPFAHSCWQCEGPMQFAPVLRDGTYVSVLQNPSCLPPEGESACPACAYELGYKDGWRVSILPPRVRLGLVIGEEGASCLTH